ncbi:MAG TPA: hypothetical protein VLW53_01860 [Candidatus Eisenbacteria bacterium]|nr:hypothetical protein [Candidatus Eisenbacteria bacterium]
MLLAAHGFPALVVAHFGEPGLPPNLIDIPWSTSPGHWPGWAASQASTRRGCW